MVLGMSLFVVFPFTRLVHVWSGFASVLYVLRPYQVARSRRLNLPAGQMQPARGQELPQPAAAPATRPVRDASPAGNKPRVA